MTAKECIMTRRSIRQFTDKAVDEAVLKDIIETPVSPELLPPKEGEIAQKTEQAVGPYILHDFFLYNIHLVYACIYDISFVFSIRFLAVFNPQFFYNSCTYFLLTFRIKFF